MASTSVLPGCFAFSRKTNASNGCDPHPPGQHVLTYPQMRALGDVPFVDVVRHVPGVVMRGDRLVVRANATVDPNAHPLLIVDGGRYTSTLSAFAMRSVDLYTVQVLLSAFDQSTYGSQGGAGVVLITTRRAGCN